MICNDLPARLLSRARYVRIMFYMTVAPFLHDPLEACPIHGFCGIWGVLAVGVFGTIDEKSVTEGGYTIYDSSHGKR